MPQVEAINLYFFDIFILLHKRAFKNRGKYFGCCRISMKRSLKMKLKILNLVNESALGDIFCLFIQVYNFVSVAEIYFFVIFTFLYKTKN